MNNKTVHICTGIEIHKMTFDRKQYEAEIAEQKQQNTNQG